MKTFIFPNGNSIKLKSIISTQVGEKVKAGAMFSNSEEIKDRVIINYGCYGDSRYGGGMNSMVIYCNSSSEAKNLLRKLNLAILRNVR